MATKKQLTNRFQSDIDLCNNQIKNATWEHWTESVLPTENLFEGRMLFLEKDIPTIIEGKAYTYEAGSVIICHKVDGEFYFLKQLSSLQTEDVTGAIKELWRSKTGLFYGEFATKAALDSSDKVKYELDIAIVNADENKGGASTLYVAKRTGSTDPQGAEADYWDYAATLGKDWQPEIDTKIDLVDEATETGGKACFAPFGMTPDFSDPEKITVTVDKIRLSKNPGPGYARVDSIDIPVPRAVIHEQIGGVEVNTAGLYTKGLADRKVDVDQGVAQAYKVLAVGTDGKVKPSDISGYIAYEGRDGVKTEPKSPTDPSQGTWIEADWSKVAKKFPLTSPAADKIYRLPYFFKQNVQADKVTVTADTIKLDNDTFGTEHFDLDVASADIANNKAGLYNKTLADAKMNVSTDKVIRTISKTVAADKITLKSDRRSLELTTTTDSENLDIPAMDGTNAGLYTKVLADAKLDLPGKAPGTDQPLRLPYFFEQSVEGDKVTVTAHTVKLDNTVNKVDEKYTMVVLPADVAGDKAGLYTKTLADVKADLSYVNTELAKKVNLFGNAPGTTEPLRLPYFFYTTPETNKIKVTAKTIGMDDHTVVGDYTLDVPAVTQTEIGLMLAADKKKLDEMLTDTETSETKTWSSKKINDMIIEYQAEHKGTFATHTAFAAAAPSIVANINDYVIVTDDSGYPGTPAHTKQCWKYVYVSSGGEVATHWNPLTMVSNVPFTPAQWEAIESGATTEKINNIAKKVDRTVKDAQNANNTIDNSPGQNGCVMQTYLDDNKTVISFNTASENGADGVLGQVYAKDYTTGQGMRINFTKTGAYYGVGASTPIDEAHELTVKGDFKTTQIQLKEDAWVVEGSFYVQEISVTGIKATDNPIISAVYDGATPDEIREQQEEANKILKGETLDGKIKFYAEDDLGLDISALVRVM